MTAHVADLSIASNSKHLLPFPAMSERRASVNRGSIGKQQQQQPAELPVSTTELQTAFAFFDRHNRGYITPDDLKARLAPLYPQLTEKDFQTMTQNKPQFTATDLAQLLTTPTPTTTTTTTPKQQSAGVGQADVLLEAFQLFDPQGRGYVDTEFVMGVLMGLGVAEVTRGDVQLLVEQNDRDKDGKIGLSDFKRMVSSHASNNSVSGRAAPTV